MNTKKNGSFSSLLVVIALMASVSAAPITFSETGAYQSYTVPNGITSILFDLLGASGGDASGNFNVIGGAGSEVTGSLSVTAGETLYIFVGGAGKSSSALGAGGFNGGGSGFGTFGGDGGGGGGGATDIRTNSTSFSSVVAIAGGGGGANGWGGYGGFGADVGHTNGISLQGGNAGPAVGGITTGFAGGGGGYSGGYQGGINPGTGFLNSGVGGSSWVSSGVVSGSSISMLGTTVGGNFGSISTSGLNGVAYLTLVPEPSTYALFGLGAFVLIIAGKRKKEAS